MTTWVCSVLFAFEECDLLCNCIVVPFSLSQLLSIAFCVLAENNDFFPGWEWVSGCYMFLDVSLESKHFCLTAGSRVHLFPSHFAARPFPGGIWKSVYSCRHFSRILLPTVFLPLCVFLVLVGPTVPCGVPVYDLPVACIPG